MRKCPFCDQEPDEDDIEAVFRLSCTANVVWRAGCVINKGGCGAEVLGYTREDAIDRWNTEGPQKLEFF